MSEDFNYEEVFMGVREKKPTDFKRAFKDDYRLKRLTEMVKKQKGRVLDIGCGGGITTESLQHYYPEMEYYGCDVSKQAIEHARKLGSGKVKYSVIKKKKLPYEDNFFDLCVCFDVMEHVPDVDFFLEEVKRITKPGGKFFLLLPTEGQPLTHTWLWQKIGIGSTMTFRRYGHIHPEFTHKYVLDLLKKHNFSISKKAYSEHFLFQLISVLTYFLPLEIMEKVMGRKNADKYTDSGVIRHRNKRKKGIDWMLYFRYTWLGLIRILRYLTLWELDAMKNNSFTAWKLIVVARKK